jgi:hypothetical protein
MTSTRQIQANRRNALASTGPRTENGKQRASQNAVRHGLTAETVIVPLEDADDYKSFEQAVTADYEAETAVERELVLRLASLLWRLRRATSIETGLLQIQHEIPQYPGSKHDTELNQGCAVTTLFPSASPKSKDPHEASHATTTIDVGHAVAHRFVRLADLDNGVFDRLGRYEAALWRQVRQTIFTLEGLRRRKLSPHKTRRYPWPPGEERPSGRFW